LVVTYPPRHPLDSEMEFEEFQRRLFEDYFRLLKGGGSAYIWVSRHRLRDSWRLAESAGFVVRNIIALVKRGGNKKRVGDNWRSSFRPILYLTKGDEPRVFNSKSHSKMLNVMYTDSGGKPFEVVQHLVEVSTNPGDLVIDSFAGYGVVLDVCRDTDRCCIGIEQAAIYKEARERKALPKHVPNDRFWEPFPSPSKQTTLSVIKKTFPVKKKKLSLSDKMWQRFQRRKK